MACRFQVNSVVIDEPRKAFVIHGVVVDGFVQQGMRVQFRSRDDGVSVPIATVETVKAGKGSELALTLFCNQAKSLERLRVFHIRNTIVEISDK
ncbi:MAG TPA: hypothetical protein VEJ63_00295 [Planctomycetota bacterium]|nr:hypothetical protein [Planctomycetota bacterium]